MRARTLVYVDARQGGFEFGMDYLTPVEWTFSRGSRLPRRAYVAYSLDDPKADRAKIEALPATFIGTIKELRDAIRA